jgi:methionine-rich copper-binding protein CopC
MNTRLCILCTALTALIALLIMLAPSPAVAQERATTLKIGTGESAKVVVASLTMLGSDKPQPDFKLLLLYKDAEDKNHTLTGFTDDKGQLRIEIYAMPKELRVFAFGDFTIPEAWSNIPVSTLKFEREEAWSLQVRPLRNVKVSGKLSIVGLNKPADRANIAFAPLDVAQDGSFRLFDEPRGVLATDDGSYEIELPAGYYQIWTYWADRSSDDWAGYIKVQGKTGIFDDLQLDLALEKGAYIEGQVVDGRTGEGVAASINFYSNQYLRQLRMFTSDGEFPDEEGPDGKEIFWPVGTFKLQAWMIDPEDFTVVIKPAGSEQVMKVIPNLKMSDLVGKKIRWELYSDDMRVVDVTVTTHVKSVPVNDLDINLLPLRIDVPQHLQQSYTASGFTDDNGVVRFMGLATGSYEVYGARGSTFLGQLIVGPELKQAPQVKFEIPFAYGMVKLADGEPCKNLEVFVWITNKAGQEFGPYPSNAFKDNPALQKEGKVFVPLLSHGSTFRIKFAAMEGGRAFEDREWVTIKDFPLVTEAMVITVEEEKCWDVDLSLQSNPDFQPKDQPKDD